MATTNPAWFNEEHYLSVKLDQWKIDKGDSTLTLQNLKDEIAKVGLTPFAHFEIFGSKTEALSPNPLFVEAEYLANKVAQLKSKGEAHPEGKEWTPALVKEAIEKAGMTVWTHFQQFAIQEEVSPSSKFDIKQYLQDKLAYDIANGQPAQTLENLKEQFKKAQVDAITHAAVHAAAEGLTVKATASTLTEALKALDKANQDKTDFLAGLELDSDFDGEIDIEKGDALETDITTSKTTAVAKVDDAIEAVAARDFALPQAATDAKDFTFTADSYTNGSANVKSALLVDVKAHLATRLAEAKAAVAVEQAKVDKVAGLNAAVKALEASKAATTAAEATAKDAAAALTGAKSTFEARETSGDTLSETAGEYFLGATKLLSKNTDGKLVVNTDWAAISANAAFKPFAEALLAAVNADSSAQAALTKAQESEYQATIARDFLDLNTVAKGHLTAVANAMVLTTLAAGTTPTLAQVQTESTKLQSLLATLEGKISAFAAGADAATTETNFKALTAAQVSTKLLTAAQKAAIDTAFVDGLDGDVTANLSAAIDDAETALETNNNSALFDAAVADLVSLEGPVNSGSSSVNELALKLAEAQALITNDSDNGWQDLLDALNKALENETTATNNVTKLESLNSAIDGAEKFFADNGYAAPELLDTAAEYASPEGDVFVLGNIDSSIANFGTLGKDSVFIGGKYVQNTTGDLTKGNDAVLEFFIKQNGSDTEVIFEQKAFGSSAASPEVFTITLTGVTATDLAIDTDFISLTAA